MRISIRLTDVRYICPLGDLNKYMSDTNISMCPTEDWNKNRSVIGIRSVQVLVVISISSIHHTRNLNKNKI